MFFAMSARKLSDQWENVPMFNNHSPHVLQGELRNVFDIERWEQIKEMSCFHKLNHHNDYSGNPKSIYSYILNKYT